MNSITPMVVLFGPATEDKPRGAKFPADNASPVRKAAQLMKLRIGVADSPEAMALLKDVPQGRIYDSGKALLPLIKRELYDRIAAAIKFEEIEADKTVTPAEQASGTTAADPWAALKPGNIVLAADPGQGWFEATVLSIDDKKQTLSLRWRDYPKFPNFSRPRIAVGILAPSKKAQRK